MNYSHVVAFPALDAALLAEPCYHRVIITLSPIIRVTLGPAALPFHDVAEPTRPRFVYSLEITPFGAHGPDIYTVMQS